MCLCFSVLCVHVCDVYVYVYAFVCGCACECTFRVGVDVVEWDGWACTCGCARAFMRSYVCKCACVCICLRLCVPYVRLCICVPSHKNERIWKLKILSVCSLKVNTHTIVNKYIRACLAGSHRRTRTLRAMLNFMKNSRRPARAVLRYVCMDY